jgi:hypothetical protein
MKEYSNLYTRHVYELLVPLVGELVTQGILSKLADKLKKTEDTFTSADGPFIAESVKKGIAIFIGSGAAEKVAGQILSLK